jgi:hypothetical protein
MCIETRTGRIFYSGYLSVVGVWLYVDFLSLLPQALTSIIKDKKPLKRERALLLTKQSLHRLMGVSDTCLINIHGEDSSLFFVHDKKET